MTLDEQLKKLEELAQKKSLAQQSMSDRHAFLTRVRQLEVTLDKWKPLVGVAREFREREICDRFKVQYADLCLSKLNDLMNAVRNGEYGTKKEDPPSLRMFWDFEREFAKKLRVTLDKIWTDHLKELENTAIGDRILEQFDYGDSSTTVGQLRELRRQLLASGGRLPGFDTAGDFNRNRLASDIESVLSTTEVIKKGVMQLPDDGMPDDVRAFLSEAKSTKGAPLSLLSENVLEWLKTHGADGMFQVRRNS
jgi:hypothetical protein